MDPENEPVIEETTEEEDLQALDEGEPADTPDWEALAKKNAGIAKRALTKLAKANEKKAEPPVVTPEAKKTGELDDNALNFLDLKGISDAEDIKVIQQVIAKTGQTVREALKDDYVQAKLSSNKAGRDVKSAMPTGTKRSGAGASDSLAQALARFDANGELPTDFELRSQVVNSISTRGATSAPSWRK